jgi:hypothetical protein
MAVQMVDKAGAVGGVKRFYVLLTIIRVLVDWGWRSKIQSPVDSVREQKI